MLNIIKNSFIMFYKYLPVLIPLGLISPVYNYYFPVETHQILSEIISYICTAIILTSLSSIKTLSQLKSYKLWIIYTITFICSKYIYLTANKIILTYILPEILTYTSYNNIIYFITVTATLGFLRFIIILSLYCAIIHKEITINILHKISSPYWKILIFMIIIDLPSFITITNSENPILFLILRWYTGCILTCFAITFYKDKRKPGINRAPKPS